MKKVLRTVAIICIVSLLLTAAAFAETDEKKAESAVLNTDDVNLFLNVGEKPDLSKGYIDFTFEDGGSERVTLDDPRLGAFPDTGKPGLVKYGFTLYGSSFSITALVIDAGVNISAFEDVKISYWAYNSIARAVSVGFFSGVSPTSFDPKGNMTRAQFCQMIYNIYKDDADVMKKGDPVEFADVAADKWYYGAVSACAAAGIVNGVGEGMFMPTNPISRQDAAIIMMRILMGDELENVDFTKKLESARASGIKAADFDSTSGYAKKAVSAALGVIFFGDSDGNLTPRNNISRAECATMMVNYFFKGYSELVYLSPENRTYNSYAGVDANESQQMYKVASLMKPMLEQLGYRVYIADINTSIRTTSEFNRADEAKSLGAAVYVALHTNAVNGTNNGSAHGTVCFYNGKNAGARELAQSIYDSLSTVMTWNSRGIHDDITESALNGQKPYAEVKNPTMANLICEVEFHDYPAYAKWIVDNTETIARLITAGIDKYLSGK